MIGVLGAAGAIFVAYSSSHAGSVNVSGAVKKPGALVVSKSQSVSSAIREMGGFALNADKRHIRITIASGEVKNIDLTQLGTIPAVQPGDKIEVGAIDPKTSVIVQGGVSKAGAFDFKPGMTVLDAVSQAEPSKHASMKNVKVLRKGDDGNLEMIDANLLAMSSGSMPPMALRAGDTVAVPFGQSMSDHELIIIVVIVLLVVLLVR
jgi:protein involved in polysaccharide export with SLBB domain